MKAYGHAITNVRTVAIAMLVAVTSWTMLPQPSMTQALPDGVELKDMTWVEVRTALQAGYKTVIVPTGGIEQNGPHMILGKHDSIVGAAAVRIAKQAGKTLVAPVVSFVPQGEYNPPTGHLQFPGTIGVSETVFMGLLDGISRSLKAGGFKNILFIGDHRLSQTGQATIAERLTREWAKEGVRVVQIGAYNDDAAQIQRLIAKGQKRETGQHASIIDTSELLSVHPQGVDLNRYRKFAQDNGAGFGDPTVVTSDQGTSLLDMRIKAAIDEIKKLSPPN